MIGLANNYLD